MNSKFGFTNLPDVALLVILRHLSAEDLINLCKINKRLESLCNQKSIVRKTSFQGCYMVKEEDFKYFISMTYTNIESLDLNHCYWWPQRIIQWACNKCKSLRELHVIECKIRSDTLVSLIASLPLLQSLSFSITTFADIKRDVFAPAKATLENVRFLHIYYTSTELTIMNYLGEHATLLDFCDNVEEIKVGSAGMAVPELYRPIISYPEKHCKLTSMSITNNIHAGAQMFFYGTLSQLPNDKIHWKTLLMPNVNFEEFSKKEEFIGCLTNMEELENLDISGSKVSFPNKVMDMERGVSLKYLNLKSSNVCSTHLKFIASSCLMLTSINLFGCVRLMKDDVEGNSVREGRGVEALFKHCPKLHHLNLAGEHHHVFPALTHVITAIKNLRSLAIPTCMLCAEDPNSRVSGKRVMSTRYGAMAPKRRQLTAGYVEGGGSPPQAGSSSSPEQNSSPPLGSPMHRLAAQNPNLRELEIVAVKFDSVFQRNRFINTKQQQFLPCVETRFVRDSDLCAVGHLKQLRRLTLAGIPGLISGHSLLSITSGCTQLEYLSLSYVGGTTFNTALCKALPSCQNIKDLRIEQPHMTLNSLLFDALCQCKKLERLCIIAKHSSFQSQDVHRLMEQVSRLTVLQVFAGNTVTFCKGLTNALQKKYQKSRPGLSVALYPVLYDGVADVITAIPAKHLEELTRFDSRISQHPPRFND